MTMMIQEKKRKKNTNVDSEEKKENENYYLVFFFCSHSSHLFFSFFAFVSFGCCLFVSTQAISCSQRITPSDTNVYMLFRSRNRNTRAVFACVFSALLHAESVFAVICSFSLFYIQNLIYFILQSFRLRV